MQKAIDMLSEVKESIINAYELKTGMRRSRLSQLMDAETWMNVNKAIEYGFADGILEDEKKSEEAVASFAFSRKAVTASLLNKLVKKSAPAPKPEVRPEGRCVDTLKECLNAIRNYL